MDVIPVIHEVFVEARKCENNANPSKEFDDKIVAEILTDFSHQDCAPKWKGEKYHADQDRYRYC